MKYINRNWLFLILVFIVKIFVGQSVYASQPLPTPYLVFPKDNTTIPINSFIFMEKMSLEILSLKDSQNETVELCDVDEESLEVVLKSSSLKLIRPCNGFQSSTEYTILYGKIETTFKTSDKEKKEIPSISNVKLTETVSIQYADCPDSECKHDDYHGKFKVSSNGLIILAKNELMDSHADYFYYSKTDSIKLFWKDARPLKSMAFEFGVLDEAGNFSGWTHSETLTIPEAVILNQDGTKPDQDDSENDSLLGCSISLVTKHNSSNYTTLLTLIIFCFLTLRIVGLFHFRSHNHPIRQSRKVNDH